MTTLYRLLTGPDNSDFCHKVTKALSEGWLLHGVPAYAADPKTGEMRCAQAVTEEVEARYDPARKLSSY